MKILRARVIAWVAVPLAALLSGCGTTGLILGAAGVATDTSITWAVVKHVRDKLTQGEPLACHRLDAVERALTPRCGGPDAAPLTAADLAAARLPECPLSLAARDARTWPALPALVAAGAQPEACVQPPLVALAQGAPRATGCVDFSDLDEPTRAALRWLADADARSVHHDVLRAFSCPEGRAAGLDTLIDGWLARGDLAPDQLGFGPLGALHPSHLGSPLALALAAQGHTALAALGGHAGQAPGGFDLALRLADRPALQWWLAQTPSLANRVPSSGRGDMAWLPLARVLRPGYLADAATQRDLVEWLLAHGADPSQRLPHQSDRTVLGQAVIDRHPLRELLDAGPGAPGLREPRLLAAGAMPGH